MGDKAEIRDGRATPFCWQSTSTLRYIREHWEATRPNLVNGLAVYMAMTELANEDRARTAVGNDSAGFEAYRSDICERAGGVSKATVDRSLAELERMEVLEVKRRRKGKVNLPSVYVLREPPAEKRSEGGLPGRPPGNEGGEGVVPGKPGVASEGGPDVKKERQEPEEQPPLPPPADDRFPEKVDRRPVTDSERELATAIVETFNSEFATAFTAAAHAKPIIGRLREQPELTIEHHAGIIATIASGRQWWDDRLSPAIIYGNPAQFERCHEQWRQAKKVRRLEPSTEQAYWEPLSEPPGPKTPTDPEKAWIELGDELVEHQGLPVPTREQWLDTATAVAIDDEFRLVIESQEAGWLQRRYAPLLKATAQWMGLAGVVIRYSAREVAA